MTVPFRLSLVALSSIAAVVAVGALQSDTWPACDAPQPGASQRDPTVVRLSVVGDIGTGDVHGQATAAAVNCAGSVDAFDALVLLGDNAYPDGDPALLNAAIFTPFQPTLESGSRLVGVLGNHDVRHDDGVPQMGALGMPDRWYSIVMGDLLLIVLDSTRIDDPLQTRWLDETLARAQQRWLVVASHHPPFSAGRHGSTTAMHESWVPLFEEYSVDLVLSGHDHDYQRSVPIKGVTYVVSGGGAKLRPVGSEWFTAVSTSVRHYLDISVDIHQIEVTAESATGSIDHFVIHGEQ